MANTFIQEEKEQCVFQSHNVSFDRFKISKENSKLNYEGCSESSAFYLTTLQGTTDYILSHYIKKCNEKET